MVKERAAEFKCAESLEEDPRPIRSDTIITPETIAKIHDVIMADRLVTEIYIATELGISQDRIHTGIHNEHHMSKVSAHSVPKLLGPDLKRTRLNMSRKNLLLFSFFLGGYQQFSSEICDYGRDLTREEVTIEAVETPRFSTFQESQFCDARRQSDDLNVLGCRRNAVGGLPRQGPHCHWSLLCLSSETASGEHKADWAWNAECSSTRTMERHTCPQWPWLLSRNVNSNLSKTHPILLIWLPLTTTSSRT